MSLADIDINAQVTLILNVGLQVSHLIVIINPVDYEVREPWILSLCLEQFIEQFKRLLAKVVPKYLE